MARFHIIIEGTDREEMDAFFDEIQDRYGLYDNCVIAECQDRDSIIDDDDPCKETGKLKCSRPKQSPNEPEDFGGP